jgi:hypothetical protein
MERVVVQKHMTSLALEPLPRTQAVVVEYGAFDVAPPSDGNTAFPRLTLAGGRAKQLLAYCSGDLCITIGHVPVTLQI